MYAKVENNVVVRYPYSVADLWRDNPQTSFPLNLSDAALAEWGMVVVASAEQPSYDPLTQVLEEGDPAQLDGVWTQQWNVRTATPEEQAQATQARITEFEQALDAHLDTTAQAKRYNDRFTCALRAGYAGPFQAEGAAFAVWMDQCNAQAYALMQSVLDGTAPAPDTVEAFIATLPPMVWPE